MLTSTSEPCGSTGSQEICPVLKALLRAKADAITGIMRADTANEIQYSTAKSIDIFCRSSLGEMAVQRRISKLAL